MPETGNEYVRKDVFDARMDRMEMLLEKTLMEMKADNDQLRSEMKAGSAQLRTEIEQLRSEVREEISGLRSEMKASDAQLRTEMEQLRSEVKEEISGLRSEMKAGDAQLRSEIRESNAQLRTEIEQLRGEVKEEIGGLRTEVGLSIGRADQNLLMVNTRINDMQASIHWGFALMSLVVALITYSPKLGESLKSLRRPAVTLEDVERVVNAALDRRAGGAGLQER